MPAVFLRRTTPERLRLLAALTTGAAVVLLIALTLVMTGVREQVRLIGEEAAPQAATSADLYFALSDLDAQVTRILLAGDSDELAGSRIDALGAYRERGYQVDQDLQRSLTTGTGETERAIVLRLMDGLTVYRQRVGQALTASASTPDTLGYYTQATNHLHLRLLPDARELREKSIERLDDAYAEKAATETTGMTVAVLLGGALLALLILLQVWMAHRFRRTLNPALAIATVLSVLLLVSATVVLQSQSRLLSDGRDDGLGPYLALSELRALGYDAAADTGRYVISANLSYYRDDFTAKSACLSGEVACRATAPAPTTGNPHGGGETVTTAASARGGLPRLAGSVVVGRWTAYRTVHERILALADAGQTAEAVRLLTGIRRGDAAFDFAYFDASVADATGAREREFDRALRAAEITLTGWAFLPGVVLTVVLALIPFGVRKRLAEYR
ncbi:hypothetical protein QLQ12_20635 [Actinoplanes sp. NEAU-A12]|uniref:Secreted protein n=1 Tax=Actinoplanes sandaracinus TaxID=3045177 RepID=A0ABT6WMS4_9ACTN|nr:hypothetical protein [Actinoplanes sandaracinus]MDI6101024.1 hypothetical protein [Actinoplanes sandaracinus]